MKSTGEVAVSSLASSVLWRTTLALFSILFAFNSLALANNWYQQIPIIDIPAHVVFGALLAAIFYLRRKKKDSALYSILLVALFTLFVGIFWELLEFLRDTYIAAPYGLRLAQRGALDTAMDLLNNIAGGAVASLVRIFSRR